MVSIWSFCMSGFGVFVYVSISTVLNDPVVPVIPVIVVNVFGSFDGIVHQNIIPYLNME